MKVSLLKLKKIVKGLEEGAKGCALSKIDVEFWLKRSKEEEVLLELVRIGQFNIVPDATFTFKIID